MDGDHLLLEAKSPPPPLLVQHLSQHKPTIIAMLRWHNNGRRKFDQSQVKPQFTSKGEIARVSDEIVAELRNAVLMTLDQLPLSLNAIGIELLVETRKFARSHWFCEAIRSGWSLEELFGLSLTSPLDDVEQWGLVTGLALAAKRGDLIEYLDAEHAVIRYRVSAPMKEARRIERRFTPAPTSVVWWKRLAVLRER